MDPLLRVDLELCTMCGACTTVCPVGIVHLGVDRPEVSEPEFCCSCGQCVAVCPEDALDNIRAPLADQAPLPRFPVLDAPTAALFMRSRRSTRAYKKKAVPRETLLQLLEIARFAPSGSNSQGLSYLVVTDPEVLKELRRVIVEWIEGLMAAGKPVVPNFTRTVAAYRTTGADWALRDSPCLIVATAPRELEAGPVSARLALEYVELYATTLGLGTCWAGAAGRCATAPYPPLLETLGIPDGVAVVGLLMAGYPRYAFKHLPDRDPLRVSWL
jgi:nitroreductase/NAD-dependent dihydropyrimidine dehydrogenase PreA subunit